MTDQVHIVDRGEVYTLSAYGDIAVVAVHSPPVNALGHAVRSALLANVQALQNSNYAALIVICEGRTFFPGADIREFNTQSAPPDLRTVINAIESSRKPVIAAIHGTALGGGLEVAMACHYRLATHSAKLGLPEVNLGLLPGAGGTQRLPRLIGVDKALSMMMSGKPISAQDALEFRLIDEFADDAKLLNDALLFAHRVKTASIDDRRVSNRLPPDIGADIFPKWRSELNRKYRLLQAPREILNVVEHGLSLPLDEALAIEGQAFNQLRNSDQSKALRYAFFAERETSNIAGIDLHATQIPISRVAIIGAGTMGTGIAACFLSTGMHVTLNEQHEAALHQGFAAAKKIITRNAEAGRCTVAEAQNALERFRASLNIEDVASADLIIEAAFETMEVKKEIFSTLDRIAKPQAILATNTSYLDVNEIAAATTRPDSVVGMHFFSPAHIMKLIEVVRGTKTSDTVIAALFQTAKRLGKIPVLSGVCHGFIGNRMLRARREKLDRMILEGASPYEIDRVAEDFGFAMGPFRVSDLAGLDLGWTAQTSTGATVRERLCESGRRGQKTNAGYYDYSPEGHAKPSPIVEGIIRDVATAHSIAKRAWSDDQIQNALITPLVEEGQRILAEGIAFKSSDIDVVWLHGYGWPRWHGGPMYYAQQAQASPGVTPQ